MFVWEWRVENYSSEGRGYRGGRSVSGGSGGICPYCISVYAGQPPTGSNRRTEQTAAEKGGVRSCRNSQKRIVCRQKRRHLSRTGWWFFPQRYYQSITQGSFFLYEYPENRKSQTLHCPSGFPIYWGGMALLEQGCGWCAAARTVGGKGTTPALPDPSIWGAGFTWTFP